MQAYPTLVAIDKAGLVADYVIGGRSEENLRQVIEKARAGAPPPSSSPVSTLPATSPPPSAARPEGVPPPASAEDFYREGVRLHAAKDLPNAIQALDSAIQLNPRMASAWELRGHCQLDSRHMPQAIAGISRIPSSCFPHSAAAFYGRGQSYLDTEKADEALADFNRAIELNPAYLPALQGRARIYMTRKQYAEALADCDAALRSNPSATWAVQRRNEARSRDHGGAPVEAELATPALLSPAAGATFSHYPRETKLLWSEVPGALSYIVEWDYKGADAWASEQRGTPGCKNCARASPP